MSTKNHFEHTLPPLSLANGMQLSAGLYSVEGGTRYRMVFGDHPERLSSPRVTFNSEAGRIAHFAGMLFRGAPRDSMAGMSMIDYFTKVAQGELGLAIGETSTMRKPIIVRCLAKYGFLASRLESTSVRAGLLPRCCRAGLMTAIIRMFTLFRAINWNLKIRVGGGFIAS